LGILIGQKTFQGVINGSIELCNVIDTIVCSNELNGGYKRYCTVNIALFSTKDTIFSV